MYIRTLIITLLLTAANIASAQNKKASKMEQTAGQIFKAWQNGEAGAGYDAFLHLLDKENFRHFSHPLTGEFKANEGYKKILSLIKEREEKPNHLTFSNIHRYSNGNRFCFQFDSEGTVSNGYLYKGYNIIQLEISNNKLVGFREYFGFIDSAWFQ
jgi:hypothetical protein